MEWLRSSVLGISDPAPPARKPNAVLERHKKDSQTKSYDERAEALVRAQAMKIEMKEMEIAESEALCRKAVKDRDQGKAKRHLMRVNQLKQELNTLRAKHNNLSQTGSKIADANQNLAQALLVKDGADELEGAVAAMDEINLDDAVDKLQDNAAIVQEHDDRLSEPILGNTVLMEDDVDDQLAAMMREQDEKDAASINFPNAHNPLASSQTSVPNTPKEENKGISN